MNLQELWTKALPRVQTVVPFSLAAHGTVAAVFRIGSHAHGTHVPPSDPNGIDDTDLMVIVIPPAQYVIGLHKFEHAEYKEGDLDVVIYDWGKWLRLIAKSNPNVVGTLWNEPEDILTFSNVAPINDVFAERQRFLSRRMYPSFIGYAHGQLHRMTHHIKNGYMGAKRKMLVEKYGYDVKNASHLIRLLRMAVEVLRDPEGGIRVRRTEDDNELIDIKRGRYSLEVIKSISDDLFGQAEIALAHTELPAAPDEQYIEHKMVDGYTYQWR